MFTIYREGVQSFSGTLERLYEVHPVAATDRRPPDSPDPARASDQGEKEATYRPTHKAIAAYRDAASLAAREPIVHAHQIMRSPVISIRPDADVRDAWARLREHRIRQMPVQSPQTELVGLLSERDVLGGLVIEGGQIRHGEARLVTEVMDREVITAEPVTDVRRIARVMADRLMTAMPIVTPQGELVGIVSRGDLLRAMTQTPPLRLWT